MEAPRVVFCCRAKVEQLNEDSCSEKVLHKLAVVKKEEGDATEGDELYGQFAPQQPTLRTAPVRRAGGRTLDLARGCVSLAPPLRHYSLAQLSHCLHFLGRGWEKRVASVAFAVLPPANEWISPRFTVNSRLPSVLPNSRLVLVRIPRVPSSRK